MKPSGIITVLSDFGTTDVYAGVMKGVILSVNPKARIVDISHEIKAGDIMNGSIMIREYCAYFPKGTVHLGVIDPGVGTARKPIAVVTNDYFFTGPDNGLLGQIISENRDSTIIHLTNDQYFCPVVSSTFHGRDIFAPVAAHLSRGIDPVTMGRVTDKYIFLETPKPQQQGDIIIGQVIRTDHFGNLITNIRTSDIKKLIAQSRPTIKICSFVIKGIRRTYEDTDKGNPMALFGSSGFLEIAVNSGRASDFFGLNSDDFKKIRVQVENDCAHR
jgi:S-adenosylmethionine hydrolase